MKICTVPSYILKKIKVISTADKTEAAINYDQPTPNWQVCVQAGLGSIMNWIGINAKNLWIGIELELKN